MTDTKHHEFYMRRCFDLGRLGAQSVSPNPMVGAVVVHNDQIIGEGYHVRRGEAHAEVRALQSIEPKDAWRIPLSTIYVSLEPCSFHGLTPPCSDLIVQRGIREVVVSCTDPNPRVSGSGIQRLKAAGIKVTTGVLEREGRILLQNFQTAMERPRPYVILKFVQSMDRFIGRNDEQVWLSNSYEKILVHKIRSEVDAIMVGTNTADIDDPKLTNREYFGSHPLRVILDRQLRVPGQHHIYDGTVNTVIYSEESAADEDITAEIVQMPFDDQVLTMCLKDLHKREVQSVLVEGGARLIGSFIEKNLWDEAWVVTTHHRLEHGVKAPLLHGTKVQEFRLANDLVQVVRNPKA